VLGALCALVSLAAGAGCAHVRPYEREDLARPSMAAEHEQREAAFAVHVYDTREGATGGTGTAGGGCGCN